MGKNAFVPKKHDPCLDPKKWDEYYYDVQMVDTVVKTGEGDQDFTIVKKEVVSKKSIREIIESQAKDVGLSNILEKFALTGDESILPDGAKDTGEVIDYSQLPQDLVEAGQYFAKLKEQFDALPDGLKKGRDLSSFMSSLTQKEFEDYFNSIKPKDEPEKKDGDK